MYYLCMTVYWVLTNLKPFGCELFFLQINRWFLHFYMTLDSRDQLIVRIPRSTRDDMKSWWERNMTWSSNDMTWSSKNNMTWSWSTHNMSRCQHLQFVHCMFSALLTSWITLDFFLLLLIGLCIIFFLIIYLINSAGSDFDVVNYTMFNFSRFFNA